MSTGTVELRIRRATPGDFEAISTLYEQLVVEGDPHVPRDELHAMYKDLLGRPDHEIFVAESGGEVVGTYALVFLPGITHGARDSAIVEDVVVAPACQRSGVGRQMMQDAMARCRQRDCYKLVLSSHVQRDAAHRFYEGLGFRKHGFSFLMT